MLRLFLLGTGAAETSAAEGEKAGDPVCGKLRVQARLCRGTLSIHAGRCAGALM